MYYYNYDPETGELFGKAKAFVLPGREDWSDENPDKFAFPAHTTRVDPPGTVTGFVRCWDGSRWKQVEDHRGETFYTSLGAPVVIGGLGPVPTDLLKIPPEILLPSSDPNQLSLEKEITDLKERVLALETLLK